ncbi:imm11 family protein [Pseudomonas frederiksbergensis]|uniref:imm11 family protein n=1 Tax=Pseudomonas frederiksbergensis TaxID=104087 RepID=UPI003D191988
MQYYILRHEELSGGFIDGDVQFFPALPDYYQVGKKIFVPETKVSLVLDKRVKKIKSDFFITTCGAFFVSEQMKSVIAESKFDSEFFPVDAKYFSGKTTEKRYFLIHANSKVACFDYLNSEYSGKSMVLGRLANGELSDDYKVRGIKKLCVEEQQVAELDFFFVDKVIWIDPLVSEALLSVAKIKGLRLNIQKI